VANVNASAAVTGESKGEMAPWGPDSSAESRDVTHVLLSPRMGGTSSPLNRKMPVKKGGEIEPRALFGLFQSTSLETEENSVTGDLGNGDFHRLPSFKTTHVEQPGLLGDIFKASLTVFARQFSMQRKKGSKYSAFYVFASLAFMFFLVKISSLGWIAVQTQSDSPLKVLTTTFHIIRLNCENPSAMSLFHSRFHSSPCDPGVCAFAGTR
jgi:hypothetical protein